LDRIAYDVYREQNVKRASLHAAPGRDRTMVHTEKDFQTLANEAGSRIVETLQEELAELTRATEADDEDAITEARNTIDCGPLSVEVRSGWYSPFSTDPDNKPAEYRLLMGTGGPACQIVGELSEYGEAETAYFEYQDWFKPWTRAHLTPEQEAVLLEYAQQFTYGE